MKVCLSCGQSFDWGNKSFCSNACRYKRRAKCLHGHALNSKTIGWGSYIDRYGEKKKTPFCRVCRSEQDKVYYATNPQVRAKRIATATAYYWKTRR